MPKVIQVVYTAGVLKPLEKIDLQEGETVEIEIKEKKTTESHFSSWDMERY